MMPRLSRTMRYLRGTFAILFPALVCATPSGAGAAPSPPAATLTLERIFLEDPPLDGTIPRALKWTEDGTRLGYLRPGAENRDVLELWVYEVEKGSSRLLLEASDLLQGEAQDLSDEEIQVLERKRITQRGITSYEWSPDGRALLVPLGGLYVYDIEKSKPLLLDDGERGPMLDPRFSPDGRLVSFVRGGEIHVVPREGGEERQLTTGATETLSHGLAEFIAMEEMGRYSGYWWSEDATMIAYLEVDESGVQILRRGAYETDGTVVTEQRYPAAGKPNARVRAGILDLASGTTRWLELGENVEYIARVDWSPDSKSLAIQVQPRDQKEIRLLTADPATGRVRTLLVEREPTYVNLHDDFRFLRDGTFLWSSERTGMRQLFHCDGNGNLLRQVTNLRSPVLALEGVNEEEGTVFFTAAARDGIEGRLYRQSIDGGEPLPLTTSPGWHTVLMSEDARFYSDIHSSLTSPPRATLHDAEGKELAVLEENPTPELDTLLRASPEFLQITAADGSTKLNAVILKPTQFDDGGRYPVLVYGYGGPGGQVVVNRWSRTMLWNQFLADQGFIVFSVDPRGSGMRGKPFEEALHMRLGTVEVEDHAAAVSYLQSLPFVDPERIAIWGWSYGGTLALMSLLATEGPYRCGIAVAPVTDWQLYDTHYTERYLGVPAENPGAYLAASSLAMDPAGMSEALLLVHGMADDNVFLDNSLAMMARLEEAGVHFELMLYPGKTHLIGGKKFQHHLYSLMFDFLRRRMPAPSSLPSPDSNLIPTR